MNMFLVFRFFEMGKWRLRDSKPELICFLFSPTLSLPLKKENRPKNPDIGQKKSQPRIISILALYKNQIWIAKFRTFRGPAYMKWYDEMTER